MRLTCNKKAYPDFNEECLKCPEYNTCAKGGEWCFVAVKERENIITDASVPAAQSASNSMIQPHDYREIKIGKNTKVPIDLEKLKEQLAQSHFPSLFTTGA